MRLVPILLVVYALLISAVLASCGDDTNYMDRNTNNTNRLPAACAQEKAEIGERTQADRTEALLRCHIRLEGQRR